MRPKGSARELEIRRETAANMLESGKGIREVAWMVKASSSTVLGWKRVLDEKEREGLKPKPPTTPKKRIGAVYQLVSESIQGASTKADLLLSFVQHTHLVLCRVLLFKRRSLNLI